MPTPIPFRPPHARDDYDDDDGRDEQGFALGVRIDAPREPTRELPEPAPPRAEGCPYCRYYAPRTLAP